MSAQAGLIAEIEQLTGWTCHYTQPHLATLDVPWKETAAVRDLVTASGLPVSWNARHWLRVTGPGQGILLETLVPGRQIALVVAEAALEVEQRITTLEDVSPHRATLPPGARTLHAALIHRGPATRDALDRAGDRILTAGPFGHTSTPTPVTDTLATLLLGNAGRTDAPVHTDDVGDYAGDLLDQLVRSPELLDVARGLEHDPATRALTVTAARTTTGRERP